MTQTNKKVKLRIELTKIYNLNFELFGDFWKILENPGISSVQNRKSSEEPSREEKFMLRFEKWDYESNTKGFYLPRFARPKPKIPSKPIFMMDFRIKKQRSKAVRRQDKTTDEECIKIVGNFLSIDHVC
ncbi:CLUMA_CG013024, isoform A [Clunio marinus]|uniref:CLUMA_CG013024, isoform A n=1 Tax=Clunio marinus TaxID=568069 RepID=A0A1J1IL04_9DIPT|nr:CLUMA_CG013024, isoform A [Clunio marinus]